MVVISSLDESVCPSSSVVALGDAVANPSLAIAKPSQWGIRLAVGVELEGTARARGVGSA